MNRICALVFGMLINFVSSAHAGNLAQLQEFCAKNNGELLQSWTCPNSGKIRTDSFCKLKTALGEQFTNGCTGTFGGVGKQFFGACVVHDFCYHNEPAVSGRSKAACDKRFLENMF